MTRCDNCPQTSLLNKPCENQIELSEFEYKEIQRDLLEAIIEFYNHDIDLLQRRANEVCITTHIFHYFVSKFKDKYSDYNIDPEYNRSGGHAKYYSKDRYAKPDLIIHKRNCNKHNLVYIEFKTNRTSHAEEDKKKIIKFVSNENQKTKGKELKPYRYKYGVSIVLNSDSIKLLWYKNGSDEPIDSLEFKIKK